MTAQSSSSPRNVSLITVLCFALCCFAVTLNAQEKSVETPTPVSMTIRWNEQAGISRYRLQIARDENFDDIILDRAVTGSEYKVDDLIAGDYYWRVAPAMGETGTYSRPNPVKLIANNTVSIESPATDALAVKDVMTPVTAKAGWRTATGEALRPIAARLRDVSLMDVVAANASGTVFAIDGASGVEMWAARYKSMMKTGEKIDRASINSLTPLAVKSSNGESYNVLAAYDEGVRLLDGATGSELWRAELFGRLTASAIIEFERKSKIIVVSNDPSILYLLDGATGRVLAQTALPAEAFGAPVPMSNGKVEKGFALTLADKSVAVFDVEGKAASFVKVDSRITTPALIATSTNVENEKSGVLLFGTEQGLVAFDAKTLRPLWRVATEDDDAPVGNFAAVDSTFDSKNYVVMLTRKGSVVAVNLSDGKIRWIVNEESKAANVVFADVNNDGALDVLIASSRDFAHALSGRDGSILWRAENQSPNTNAVMIENAPVDIPARRLAIVTNTNAAGSDGKTFFVVGSDAAQMSLRAYQLPRK